MTDATQAQTTYGVRDGDTFKQVSYDEYCDAFDQGLPVFVMYPASDAEAVES